MSDQIEVLRQQLQQAANPKTRDFQQQEEALYNDPYRYLATPTDIEQSQSKSLNQLKEDLNVAALSMTTKDKNFAPPNPLHDLRPITFDPSPKGFNYERYYNHPKFKELGFSPFRDNEEFYNQNSSWWDDMQRTWGQFGTLVSLGFKDAFTFGDVTDREMAEGFEKAMNIGMSTRGGIGGFTNDLFLNSGYTFGIMGAILAEDIPLMLMTAGLSSVKTATSLGKAAYSVGKASKVASKTIKLLDTFKDVNKTRAYFADVVKGGANFLNPFGETAQFVRQLNKGALTNVNGLAKTAIGMGQFYKDIRNARLAFGESALEGGLVQNELENQLFDEFYKKNGYYAEGAEADRIKQTAEAAGRTTTMTNFPVILLSNKMVFDGLFNAFSPLRSLSGHAVRTSAGVIRKTAAKEAPYKLIKSQFQNLLHNAKSPKAYARFGLNYFKANFAEGLQETAQESIAFGAKEYYERQYNNLEEIVSPWSAMVRGSYYYSLADGLQSQMSPEGVEVFLSGFLMGGMVNVTTAPFTYAKANHKVLLGGKNYKKMRAERQAELEKVVEVLNQYHDDPTKLFNTHVENLVELAEISKRYKEAEKVGDKMAALDLKSLSEATHIMTVLESGMLDSYIERLEELKNLNEEEFKEIVPAKEDGTKEITLDQYRDILDLSIAKAKTFEKLHAEAKQLFPDPYDLTTIKDEDARKQASFSNIANQHYRKQFIFMNSSFREDLERKQKILNKLANHETLSKLDYAKLAPIFEATTLSDEVKILKEEIKVLEGVTEKEAVSLKKEKEEQLEIVEALYEELTNVISGKSKSEVPLFEKYSDLVNMLAKKARKPVSDKMLAETFMDFLDIHKLEERSIQTNLVVNKLLDPTYLEQAIARGAKVTEAVHKNRRENNRKVLEAFLQKVDEKNLAHALHDMGVFMTPEGYDKLINEGYMPDELLDAVTLDPIEITSDKFKEAYDLIEKMVTVVMNKPIVGRVFETDPYGNFIEFSPRGRMIKPREDKRTLENNSRLFNFKPQEPTSISILEVLQGIIDSDYASEAEIELAKKLKAKFSGSTQKITFQNNPKAIEITASNDVIIDPRAASYDYSQGEYPIETMILKALLTQVAVKEYETDTEFQKSIDELLDKIESKLKEDTELLKEMTDNDRLFVALNSPREFIISSMLSPDFQRLLSKVNVESKNTIKNGWVTFLDKIIEFLKTTLDKVSNSALNEAVFIISSKIDNAPTTPVSSTTTTTPTKGVGLNQQSDWNTIVNTPELIKELVKAFRDFNKSRIDNGEESLVDPKITDDELVKSPVFKSYVTNPSISTFSNVFKEYNDKNGLSTPTITPKKTSNVKNSITDDQRKTLSARGFTAEEMDAMSREEAEALINSNKTKAQLDAELVAEQQRKEQEDRETLQKIYDIIDQKFGEQNYADEIEALKTDIFVDPEIESLLNNFNGTPSIPTIMAHVNTKAVEALDNLSKETLTLSDLKLGEIVSLHTSHSSLFEITAITDETNIEVMKTDSGEKTNVKLSEILHKNSKPIDIEPANPENPDMNIEVVNNEEDKTKSTKEDLEKAKIASEEDINDEIFNIIDDDINNCKR
jgi:hypothetical protein